MEKLKDIYSFRLQTQFVAAVLAVVCSLSLMCEIPLEIKEIVITGGEEDHVSFKLFMNKPIKDMAGRIFF
jgi:hypothetical protein